MARRRSLRPEEAEIWAAVARTARPMHPGRQLFLKEVEAPAHAVSFHPETPAPHGHAQPRVPFFQLGEKSKPASRIDLTPTPAQALAAAPLQMDAKTHGKMTRGKLTPEARIDLQRISSIYQLAPQPQVGAVAFSLVICFALWGLVSPAWLVVWLVARVVPDPPPAEHHEHDPIGFLDVLRDGAAPQSTGWEGFRVMQLVEAAYASIESGGPTAVNLVTQR